MKLSIERKHIPVIAIAASAGIVAIAAVVAAISSSSPPELAVTPRLDCDPEWLTTETSDISYSTQQVRLYLDNRDASLCGNKSMMRSLTIQMAQVYLARAYEFTTNPKHPCSKLTYEQCLMTFMENLQSEVRGAKKAEQKLALMSKIYALSLAIESHINKQPLPQITGGDVNFASLLIDNLVRDTKAAMAQSDEGLAKDIQTERQEQRKLDAELDGPYIKAK